MTKIDRPSTPIQILSIKNTRKSQRPKQQKEELGVSNYATQEKDRLIALLKNQLHQLDANDRDFEKKALSHIFKQTLRNGILGPEYSDKFCNILESKLVDVAVQNKELTMSLRQLLKNLEGK